MTKLPINYKNACIYEIVCKDINVTQRYVGSTTNLIQRRSEHKKVCNNENGKHYNYYVYQFISENGSFENWDVVLIEQVIDCKDNENLHKRERHYIESLKAELNKKIPLRTKKEYDVDNREKKKEYRKEYCENNKNKLAECQRAYRANNNEKYNECQRAYHEKNKNKINERRRIYYANKKKNLN